MKLSIDSIDNSVKIKGLTVEQLESFNEADLNVVIKDSVLYTDLDHLGYILWWLSDMMTIILD